MNKNLNKIIKNPFIKNIVIIAFGTATAQIVGILLSPIITRIYGPEVFGVFGVFMSFVGILTPLVALSYPLAIVLPKSKDEAKGIAYLSMYIALIFSVGLLIVILLFSKQLINLFALEEIAYFIYLIPVALIVTAMFQIIEKWMIRTKQFKMIAKAAFLNALIIGLAKIGLGLINPIALILIIIGSLTYLGHAILLFVFSYKLNYRVVTRYKRKTPVKTLLKKYNDFPLYRTPQDFINAFSQNIPVILLTSFTGPATAGFFTLAKNVLNKPLQLVGKSVSDVFYPYFAENVNHKKKISNILIKSTLMIALVGVVPFTIIFMFGPQLFGFVFGSEWIKAGEYARWLSIWLWLGLANRSCVAVIPIIKQQKGLLIYEIFSTTSKVLALILGFYFFENDIIAIMLFSLVGFLAYLYLILWVIIKTIKFDKKNMEEKEVVLSKNK